VSQVAEAWAEALATDPAPALRTRHDRWSTLEYGCHVRDVFRVGQVRVTRMLHESDPEFANWDQDETAIADRYGIQDPSIVASQVLEAAGVVAASLESASVDDWPRTGRRSDGACFTVETFARYLIHDPVHHLWDVGAPLESGPGAPGPERGTSR
jgi:hypothetical protein